MVEDETGVRELASEFLRAGGYKVLEAGDGAAALTIVRNHKDPIHLLLTDMVMPGMNGRNLAQKVHEIRPEIRVMFMTGYAEFPEKNGNNSSPEGEVLQKPFSRSTLLGKVHEIVNPAHRTTV